MNVILAGLLLMVALSIDLNSANAQSKEGYSACAQQDNTRRSPQPRNRITPRISWAAWADLLKQQWTKKQIASSDFFDENKVAQAFAAFGKDSYVLPYSYYNDIQNYVPLTGPGDVPGEEAYAVAAKPYRNNNWQASIPLLDAVAADTESLFRAAASYTAARAAIKSGHFRDGVKRINRLIADPAFEEFHPAAHRLLGTMAFRTGASPVIGARLAEISHLLMAPPVLNCRDETLRDLTRQAAADLSWYMNEVFPRSRFSVRESGAETRRALEQVAQIDSVMDLTRVIAAPTQFNLAVGGQDWPLGSDLLGPTLALGRNLPVLLQAFEGERQLTDYARKQWIRSRNPLWGYALAKRTKDGADIKFIHDMVNAMAQLPNTPAILAAKPVFIWHYLLHGTRLLLISGKVDEAISFLLKHAITEEGDGTRGRSYRYFTERKNVIDGGLRHLLKNLDLDGARRWANATESLVTPSYKPLAHLWLSASLAELKKNWKSSVRGHQPFSVVNLLPTKQIIDLASGPTIGEEQRRKLLSAGWLRLYMLGKWDEVILLLPRMRAAFPELAMDFDAIDESRLQTTKRRLIAKLLLRAPGLTPRISWARRGRWQNRKLGVADVLKIDFFNPSDANWWCALNIDQLKIDLVQAFYAGLVGVQPLSYPSYWPETYPSLMYTRRGTYDINPERRKKALELADRLIAWHPLLKSVDFDELKALSEMGSGPRFLTELVVRWADESGMLSRLFDRDRFLPETLHLAVRSTRYGCRRDGGHKAYSKVAFKRLRKMYPKSDWARRTPFWFDRPGR